MSISKEVLSANDVITVETATNRNFIGHPTFKLTELIQRLGGAMGGREEMKQEWFYDGVNCEVLSPHQKWRKGKIRITIEFIPETLDQPDPDLDGLRQLIVE